MLLGSTPFLSSPPHFKTTTALQPMTCPYQQLTNRGRASRSHWQMQHTSAHFWQQPRSTQQWSSFCAATKGLVLLECKCPPHKALIGLGCDLICACLFKYKNSGSTFIHTIFKCYTEPILWSEFLQDYYIYSIITTSCMHTREPENWNGMEFTVSLDIECRFCSLLCKCWTKMNTVLN